jgi:hypothetical protein
MAAKDYTGLICGCWKVLERDKNPKSKSHETFWKCECQNCGNIASVRKTDLDKAPKSCKKCQGEVYGLKKWKIGDRFGKLTIIGPGHNAEYVKVQCDCGCEPYDVRLSHLKGQGHSYTVSCGCANESSGELKIKNILIQNDINFQKQYRVKFQGTWIVFDFVIMNAENKIIKCIEFNGRQHYEPIDYFGGIETFKYQQERDQRKRDWCQAHAVILQEIPYNDYDKINLKMLINDIEDEI